MARSKTGAKLKVVFEQEGTGWRASTSDADAWGRSLSEARRRIKKSLGAAGKKTELVEDVRLPGNAKKELERYADARVKATAEVANLRRATRSVVSTLTGKFGISLRDASSLLGLSRERVRQLTD
jgi:hypothetical protein